MPFDPKEAIKRRLSTIGGRGVNPRPQSSGGLFTPISSSNFQNVAPPGAPFSASAVGGTIGSHPADQVNFPNPAQGPPNLGGNLHLRNPTAPQSRPGGVSGGVGSLSPTTPTGQLLPGQTGPVPQDQWGPLLQQNTGVAQEVTRMLLDAFGMIPGGQATLVSLVNKVVNEGLSLSGVQLLIEQGYNVPDDLREALDIVGLEYGPQENAAERAIQQIREQLARDMGIQVDFGENFDEQLVAIGQALQAGLSGIGTEIGNLYTQGNQQVQQGYGAAGQALQGFAQEGMQNMTADAERLGIEQALASAIPELQGFLTQSQGHLANNQGISSAELAGLGTQDQVYNAKYRGIQQVRNAQDRTDFGRQIQAALAELQNDASLAINEQQGALTDIAGNRGAAVRDALREVENRDYERDQQLIRDEFERGLAERGMSVQEQQLVIGQMDQALNESRFRLEEILGTGDLANQTALIGAQIRQLDAELGLIGADIDVRRAQIELMLAQAGVQTATIDEIMANIGLTEASTDALQNETNNPDLPPLATTPAIPAGSPGQQALEVYYNSGNNFFQGPAPEGFRTAVQQLIQMAEATRAGTNPFGNVEIPEHVQPQIDGLIASGADGISVAAALLNLIPELPVSQLTVMLAWPTQALFQALQAYYG